MMKENIDEISIKRTEKMLDQINDRQKSKEFLAIEAAIEFGKFVGMGIKDGFTVEQSFALAKNHFKTFGQAMIDISEVITLEMIKKK